MLRMWRELREKNVFGTVAFVFDLLKNFILYYIGNIISTYLNRHLYPSNNY